MKQKRNAFCLVAVCLAVIILTCNAIAALAATDNRTFDDLTADQKPAVDASEALTQYFTKNGWVTEYPKYFGGSYIEDNLLIIRLVSPSEQTMDTLKKVLRDYAEVVIYEYCDISNTAAQTYADNTAKELIDHGCGVTHWYVDSVTGNVVIGTLREDIMIATEIVEGLRDNSQDIPTPKVILEVGEYSNLEATTIYGGTRITYGSNFSAGTCGYYNGMNALVTCGHIGASVGSTITLNSTPIGTVADIQYSHGEAGDYSIIVLNDNANISHKVGNSSDGFTTITNGTYQSPTVGTYIKKYGQQSKYAYGIVSATNASLADANGIVTSGFTRVTLYSGTSAGGDSGGPYMVGNSFCGVHRGSSLNSNGVRVTSFTPYSLIAGSGFSAIGTHSCNAWVDAGESNHSGYCLICKETVYESHADYWNDALGKCSRCGRTGSITGA